MKTIAFINSTINNKYNKQLLPELQCGEANGYVAISPEHPLYYLEEYKTDEVLDVHGGITWDNKFNINHFKDIEFITPNVNSIPEDWRVFGFDTMHIDDNPNNWNKEKVIKETLDLQQQLEELCIQS